MPATGQLLRWLLGCGDKVEVVAPEDVLSRAQEVAAGFAATLHTQHHLASKLKARAAGLAAIQAGIDGLAAEFGG